MKRDRFAQLKKITLRAANLPSAKREAYLAEACRNDPDLRREAESILAQGAKLSAILQKAGNAPQLIVEHEGEVPPIPLKIAGYRIINKLGEGGMGVVYEADQESPRRRVALKVMRGDAYLDNHRVRLFQREIKALARLKHSGIAAIYESGRTEVGEQYFAMELVNGVTLNNYLVRNPIRAEFARSDLRDRLGLFCQICHCISYAHQNGVIHRDLKPSNILVTADVGGADECSTSTIVQVKILDFGLARITDADVSMTTMMTEVGKIQGTLSYMSPEQARGNPDEIDFRSDVYALGVILYEMLTGNLPYDVQRTMVHDAVRVILQVPPRKPSTLMRVLRGDLETILLKALEKEPARRYQSAVVLVADVERYLADKPILARPPSTVYQFRKLVARHRGLFGALATVFAALAGGLVFSTFMYLRAEHARAESEQRQAEAEAVTGFLGETLAAVDPAEALGREVTVREMLDKASEKAGKAFADQPRVEAALRMTIGNTYLALGEYQSAQPHLESAVEFRKRVLGEDHPDTLAALTNLLELYGYQGYHAYEKAESQCNQVLEMCRRVLGEDHPNTLTNMDTLAYIYLEQGLLDKAIPLNEQVLKRRRDASKDDHLAILHAMNNLGLAYKRKNRFAEAEPLLLETLEIRRRVLGEEHPDTISTLTNLGCMCQKQGRFEEAEPLLMKALELGRRVLGEDHAAIANTLYSLAGAASSQGRDEEAERLYCEAIELGCRVQGEEHPDTIDVIYGLAKHFKRIGRYEDAEPLFIQVLEIRRRSLGEEHPWTVNALHRVASIYFDQGRYEEAEPLFREALARHRRVREEGAWAIQFTLRLLSETLFKLNKLSEAEATALECYELNISFSGSDHTATIKTIDLIARLYDAWGKQEEAAEWRAKLVENEAGLLALQ